MVPFIEAITVTYERVSISGFPVNAVAIVHFGEERRMRSFGTETEARQFFVERIVQQAQREGVSLSEDERQMLLWSESAPDSVADVALADRLAAEISDADYESKIVGLLRDSFNRDTAWIRARNNGGAARCPSCAEAITTS